MTLTKQLGNIARERNKATQALKKGREAPQRREADDGKGTLILQRK